MKKLVAASFVACLGSAAFAYGPLLPWSPVKPGYAMAPFTRAEVFFGQTTSLLAGYREIDAIMTEAEAFHRLRFQRPVRVIACKNWGDCERGLPWLRVHSLGGVALATGDVIYITPKLAEMHFSTREFLRHELSHALLHQNTTLFKAYRIGQASPWLTEGLAVSFGRQRDYFSREQFLEMAARVDLAGYFDPAHPASPWNARFAYPTQRYFIEYLKRQHGEDAFAAFLRQAIAAPDRTVALFGESFHRPMANAIDDYQGEVRSGAWPPPE